MMIDSPLDQSDASIRYPPPITALLRARWAGLRRAAFSVVDSPGEPLPAERSRPPSRAVSLPFRFFTVLRGVEMLHFRSTVALKELFQTQLRRPLAGRGGATPAAAAGFCRAAAPDGRAPGAGGRAPQTLTGGSGARGFCSKGAGHNEAAKESATEK